MKHIANFAFIMLWPAFCLAQSSATQPANPALAWQEKFSRDENGFTQFPLVKGARVILVSSSEGDDFNNDGVTKPVKTIGAAIRLTRNKFADRILLKRGDVFTKANFNDDFQRGGKSETEPFVLGAYGDVSLPRPVVKARVSLGGRAGKAQFLVIQSLDLYAQSRDPSSPGYDPDKIDRDQFVGINLVSDGQNLWLEDCRVGFFGNGVVIQAIEGQLYHTLVIRRCVVANSHEFDAHAQGVFLNNIDSVLIEQNVIDHNGWVENEERAFKTIFNHDLYLQRGGFEVDRHFIVRDNIIARASSHGCQLRCGGLMENNLFLKNPMAGFVEDTASIIRNNVVLDADNIGDVDPRGEGFELLNCPSVLVEGNVLAHKTDPNNAEPAFRCNPELRDEPTRQTHVEIRKNVVYGWFGRALDTQAPNTTLSVHDNYFIQQEGYLFDLAGWTSGLSFTHNFYASNKPDPFQIDLKPMGLAAWREKTGDNPAGGAVKFADPTRDIASYAKSIGLAQPTLEGFLKAAADQRLGHWDARLTAQAANDYIRAGFTPVGADSPWKK